MSRCPPYDTPSWPRLSVVPLLALGLVACSDEMRPPSPRQFGQQQLAPVAPSAAASCKRAGPLGCDLPPMSDPSSEACAHLRRCVEGRVLGDERILKVTACEPPAMVTGSDRGSALAVATGLEVDGPPSHGAFVLTRLAQGWCAADMLLPPAWTHGGYCSARFDLTVESAGRAPVLALRSERICHIPLDQKEKAAGQSNIAASECRQARYRVDGGRLEKLSEAESEGPCKRR